MPYGKLIHYCRMLPIPSPPPPLAGQSPAVGGARDLQTMWSPPVSLNQERDTQKRKAALFFFLINFNLLFLKSPPRNPLLANLITTTLFLLKFSFSPGFCAVHRSQFQATSARWSKASNLHYSFMRLPPPPPSPSLAKHTQLSYAGLCHSRGGCRARPGRPFVCPVPKAQVCDNHRFRFPHRLHRSKDCRNNSLGNEGEVFNYGWQ